MFAIIVMAFEVCSGQEVAAMPGNVQDSSVVAISSDGRKEDFHRFMMSFGKSFTFSSSAQYFIDVAMHVRAYKNLFVGLNVENVRREWRRELEADTIFGIKYDLSVLAFSNPIFRRGWSAMGLYGDFGAGIFTYDRWVGLPGGFNYYDKFSETQWYMRLNGGVYYKYRGIIATLGIFVSNLDLRHYDGHKASAGIFRRPREYGLQLSVRFVMW